MHSDAHWLVDWLVGLLLAIILGLAAPQAFVQSAAAAAPPSISSYTSTPSSDDYRPDSARPPPVEADIYTYDTITNFVGPVEERGRVQRAFLGLGVVSVAPSISAARGATGSADELLSNVNVSGPYRRPSTGTTPSQRASVQARRVTRVVRPMM